MKDRRGPWTAQLGRAEKPFRWSGLVLSHPKPFARPRVQTKRPFMNERLRRHDVRQIKPAVLNHRARIPHPDRNFPFQSRPCRRKRTENAGFSPDPIASRPPPLRPIRRGQRPLNQHHQNQRRPLQERRSLLCMDVGWHWKTLPVGAAELIERLLRARRFGLSCHQHDTPVRRGEDGWLLGPPFLLWIEHGHIPSIGFADSTLRVVIGAFNPTCKRYPGSRKKLRRVTPLNT